MKVKRMGITEILRTIWLFSSNKMKSSESFRKQPTQIIVELNSSLQHIIVTKDLKKKQKRWENITNKVLLFKSIFYQL